jgi:ActR/RegA family two-component response regulator
MRRSSLIAIIAITLLGFILFKGAASLLCEPKKPNSVANVISDVASNIAAPPDKAPAKVDPLSWEPILHRMMNFFAKACPR